MSDVVTCLSVKTLPNNSSSKRKKLGLLSCSAGPVPTCSRDEREVAVVTRSLFANRKRENLLQTDMVTDLITS